jgi:TolB protein
MSSVKHISLDLQNVHSGSRRTFVASSFMGMAALAHGQFRVEISGVGTTQLPIAIGRFKDEERAGQVVSNIIRSDLERSGMFSQVPVAQVIDENAQPVFSEWRSKPADALVGGAVVRLPDGRFDVRFRLWDVVKSKVLGGQSNVVVPADLRYAAHRIADFIYEKLTGERGIFSTRLAYVTKGAGRFTLRISDADGEGGQVALNSAEPIISPAWSPDGRELAYVSFEQQKAVVYVQDLSTGKRRVLANFKGSNSAPAWSPDGQTLAVTLSREGGSQIFMMGRSGSGLRRLTQSSAIDTEPVFSQDGRNIYFVSDRGGSPQIYRTSVTGSPTQAERVTFSGTYNISPALSPDGKTLAYINRQGNAFRLHTLDISSGKVQALSDTQQDESPSFAANGKLIAFATRSDGRDGIMTTTLDGKIKTKLISTTADVREPVWGPFGR